MPFRRIPLPWIFGLVCLVLLLPTKGTATPAERYKVTEGAVPGLAAYMQKNYMGRPTYHVWAVDLDEPGDQVKEVILHIEHIDYCGSGGCEWSILRREPDGQLVAISTILAGDVRLEDAPILPHKQAIASTRHGDRLMEISGKTSGQVQQMRSNSAAKRSPKSVAGACIGGYLWSGGASETGGVAQYETCGRDDALVRFECQKNVGTVDVRFAIEKGSHQEDETIPALFSVIKKRQTRFFPNPGRLKIAGTDRPVLSVQFDRYDGFLDAMKQGHRAMFNASISKIEMHLKGSSKALSAMMAACPDRRQY